MKTINNIFTFDAAFAFADADFDSSPGGYVM
jgi:hypothetical protein